jgi:hypothetical protein
MESSPGLDNEPELDDEPELDYERALYVNVTRKVVKHMLADGEVLYCFDKRETSKNNGDHSRLWERLGINVPLCLVWCIPGNA